MGKSYEYFINIEGERALAGDYLGVHDFQDGLCRVATLKAVAYIDRLGQTVWEGAFVDRP
jgi:hypothetical protein